MSNNKDILDELSKEVLEASQKALEENQKKEDASLDEQLDKSLDDDSSVAKDGDEDLDSVEQEDEETKVVEAKEVDRTRLRQSAYEQDDEGAIERERSLRMRFVSKEDEEEVEEDVSDEMSEEEYRLAEIEAKKEQEKLEKEFRQKQFREDAEKMSRYREHSRIINEHNQNQRLQEELDRRALEKESAFITPKPTESKEDDFLDAFNKRNDVEEVEDEDELIKRFKTFKGYEEKEDDKSKDGLSKKDKLKSSFGKKKKPSLDEFYKKNAQFNSKNLNDKPFDSQKNSEVLITSGDNKLKDSSVFTKKKPIDKKEDDFLDNYKKSIVSKSSNKSSQQGDNMKVNGVYSSDNSSLGGLKQKDVGLHLDKNLSTEESKVLVKKASDSIAKESSGIVQGAGPSMGQDSSEGDESKKKSNAKKISKIVLDTILDAKNKTISVNGVQARLVKNSNPTDKLAKLGDNNFLKGTLSQLTKVDDRKTSEENARSTFEKAVTVLSKEKNFQFAKTSADKFLEDIDSSGSISGKKFRVKSPDKAITRLNKKESSRSSKTDSKLGARKNRLLQRKTANSKGILDGPSSKNKLINNKESGLTSSDNNLASNDRLTYADRVARKRNVAGSLSKGTSGSIASSKQVVSSRRLAFGDSTLKISSHKNLKLSPNSRALSRTNLLSSDNVAFPTNHLAIAGRGVRVNGQLLADKFSQIRDQLSQHSGAVGSLVGQLARPNDRNDDRDKNPMSYMKSLRQELRKFEDASSKENSNILAKGIEVRDGNVDIPEKHALKTPNRSQLNPVTENQLNTRKKAESKIFEKNDGTLRVVRDGHDSGIRDIKADAPGIEKEKANKKLLEGRKSESKTKLKTSSDNATNDYKQIKKSKDGTIRLSRDKGSSDLLEGDSKTSKSLVDKLNSRQNAVSDKFKTFGKNGKFSNIHVGRSARISTKGGPLAEQAKSAKEAHAFIQKYMSKNGLGFFAKGAQTGQVAAQTNPLTQIVAKKAVATVAATGLSGGAIIGGTAALRSASVGGDIAVIAASAYDSETDDKALTQDAVDMLQARLNAYSLMATGREPSQDLLDKAGAKYVPLHDIGLLKTYNGKPVSVDKVSFKFVDRDNKPIEKDKFLLDDRSDLIMPTEITIGTNRYGGGAYSLHDSKTTNTGHPLDVPYVITQGLHQYSALDLAAPQGSPIFAIGDGEVVDVNSTAMHINGNYLIHTIPTGDMVYYGHMVQPPNLRVGDTVKKGQVIGYVGSTGFATGPHIHFDIHRGALWQFSGLNPYNYLPGVPNGAVGITVDPRTFVNPDAPEESPKKDDKDSNNSSGSGSNKESSPNSGSVKKDQNGQTQMDIMFNMLGALETGGQVYGKRDYSNFINVEAGAEVTATLGWSSFYGVNGRNYLRRFKEQNPDLFDKLDQGGQVAPVLDISWEATGFQANPTQRSSIVSMLTTEQGRKLQDDMTAERLSDHWKRAARLTDNMQAIAWYTNIAELAGTSTAEFVFDLAAGNYSLDNLYNITMSRNGSSAAIGAPMYHRRHALYREWIEQYFGADEKVDLDNIKVTGAGGLDAKSGNRFSSSDSRAGQKLLIKLVLSMAAVGSHYAQPDKEEDFFKYCIEVLDHAVKGNDEKGITINYIEGKYNVTANVEFKVLSDLYALEKLDKKFKKWDLSSEKYGDRNPQAYIALPDKDFEEIFNIKIKPINLGSNSSNGGNGPNGNMPYVKWALEIADNPTHGYSQVRRNGNPDYDCSSFVWYALKQAGFDVGGYAFTTFTMPSILKSAGFEELPFSPDNLQPGDILLRAEHTEIYVGNGNMVGAHADEIGGIVGAQGGDQGIATLGGIGEISVVPTGNNWASIYRPPKSYTDGLSSFSSSAKGSVAFDSNGLLKMKSSDTGQKVINLLFAIPGRANGGRFHKEWGIDELIDKLSVEEAVWVLHRIEGSGFGQTGAGYAGSDNPTSHQALVDQQINGRFNGSIHELLKRWGTYTYSGY